MTLFQNPILCAQILTLYILLQATRKTFCETFFQFPIYLFFFLALLFEAWHFIYFRRKNAMIDTWNHLEELRKKRDLLSLLELSLKLKGPMNGTAYLDAVKAL